MRSIELSELMIVASVEYSKEAEIHGFDPKTQSLEDWVNRVGIDIANEVGNIAIEKLVQIKNKIFENLEDQYRTMSEEEIEDIYPI